MHCHEMFHLIGFATQSFFANHIMSFLSYHYEIKIKIKIDTQPKQNLVLFSTMVKGVPMFAMTWGEAMQQILGQKLARSCFGKHAIARGGSVIGREPDSQINEETFVRKVQRVDVKVEIEDFDCFEINRCF